MNESSGKESCLTEVRFLFCPGEYAWLSWAYRYKQLLKCCTQLQFIVILQIIQLTWVLVTKQKILKYKLIIIKSLSSSRFSHTFYLFLTAEAVVTKTFHLPAQVYSHMKDCGFIAKSKKAFFLKFFLPCWQSLASAPEVWKTKFMGELNKIYHDRFKTVFFSCQVVLMVSIDF